MRIQIVSTPDQGDNNGQLSRRSFLGGTAKLGTVAALSGLLAACGQEAPAKSQIPTPNLNTVEGILSRISLTPGEGEWGVPKELIDTSVPPIALPDYTPTTRLVRSVLDCNITSGPRYSINHPIATTWIGDAVGTLDYTSIPTLVQEAYRSVLDNPALQLTQEQKEDAIRAVAPFETTLAVYTTNLPGKRYGAVPTDFVIARKAEVAERMLRAAFETGNYDPILELAGEELDGPFVLEENDAQNTTGTTVIAREVPSGRILRLLAIVNGPAELRVMPQIFKALLSPEKILGGLIINELATFAAVGVEAAALPKLEAFGERYRLANTQAAREALTTMAHWYYLQSK